ncbi:MAG TPA: HAMP domain-containing sensor histidine kinase [Negativicutes bacterium]|nr:HAMP domain-containing sensor histidine kinase [Negativicutes bacterium]
MMQKVYRRFSLLFFLLILIGLFAPITSPTCSAQVGARQTAPESRILIITSQPYATEWFNSFNDRFVEEISKARPFEPKISYEYIDGKIAANPELAATVVTFLKQKYTWEHIDLVVGVMPAGSAFLLEYGEQFAKGIPQLFVLPAPQQIQMLSLRPSVGIIQSTGDAIAGTIKNIKALLPNTKNLYVVAGAGADDREYFARTKRLLTSEKSFENVIYFSGLSTTELINELSVAPQDSAVLLLTYVLNNHGQPVTTTQVMRTVAPQIHLPIFSFYDTVLGSGIVGGHLTSTESYGEATAAAAQRLLSGEQSFFAMTASPRFMYDWRQLKRWQIDESKLPEGSRIKFVEYTTWDLYKWHITGAFLLLALQGFFIALLLLNRNHRRALENALRLSNVHLESTVMERTQELTASNEELIASNEELTAMNEEMTAMNETLDSLNRKMASEISERQRVETVLENANLKLKELDHMKSMFIASMSHELRTPLNSIIGFTGMTLQEMSGPLNEEQKDNLSRVKRSANHLLALITDVIDISKIESGKIESHTQSFSLNELVAEAVESVRPLVDEKGMSIEVQTEPDVAMLTDRRRLLQCLINFLSNAAKYSESGKITLGRHRNNGEVELSVTDTGIGIATEDLPKLFEPFERVKSHLQVKAGGTGLGLYLTKKLATEVLRGEVSVESVQGAGSTFRIRVPEILSKEGTSNENGTDN